MGAPAQPNTSASGGAILPVVSPVPVQDPQLTDFFQALTAALSNLPPQFVFPRWQQEPPNLPPYGTDWAAIGITDSEPDRYAAYVHNGAGQGFDQFQRHEQIDLMASFYGPNARGNASLLSDNLQMPQNREVLTLNTMGLTWTGKLTTAPALIKQQWTMRVDLPFRIKRGIKRTYLVLNLLGLQVTIKADDSVNGTLAVPVVVPYPNQTGGST